MPGDTFGVRVLLPDDEIVKRLTASPDDLKRSNIINLISKKSTIARILSNF